MPIWREGESSHTRREYWIQGAQLMAPVSKMQTVWPWGRLAAEVWSVTQIRVGGDAPPPSPSPLLARCLLVWGGVWGVCIFRADPDCISGLASWNHAFHGRARGCRGAPVGTAARSGHVNPNLCLERDQLVSSRTSSGHGGAPCSGSCLRRWHCRTLAPKLSNVPLERQACSLWNPFHLCYSQTSETVLSASILLLY